MFSSVRNHGCQMVELEGSRRCSCICAWCHVSRLTKYEGTQGTHDCTKDDLCTSDFRFLWACLVYSGLKCGQTAARGISLVSRCPCVRSDDGSRMSSRVSVPRGPASRRLPPRQLPPRPRPTRGGPPVPDVPCPGRCNNLVLTLFTPRSTSYNRVVPSSIVVSITYVT